MMPEGLDRLRNARILVVEDSIANQTLARDLLLHAGAHVDLAGNGKEAIAAIENADEPYDAVLMDLQMPIMDGLEATGVIRGRLALDKLPIIATTANIGKKEHNQCIAAGATDSLPKPFHIHQLYAVLIRWLGPVKAAAAPGDADGDGSPAVGEATLPTAIEGIDVESGLARTGGKRELYASLLLEFAGSSTELQQEFEKAAGMKDWDRIRFLVHGIRSTAGIIGADALSGAAADLERAIVGGDEGLAERLVELRAQLDAIVAAIGAAGVTVRDDRVRAAARQGNFNRGQAERLLGTLLDMLEDQDMDAERNFAMLVDVLAGHGMDRALEEIGANIDALQFSNARQILSRLAEDFRK